MHHFRGADRLAYCHSYCSNAKPKKLTACTNKLGLRNIKYVRLRAHNSYIIRQYYIRGKMLSRDLNI